MPLDTPETTQSDVTWTASGRLNAQSTTSFQLHITTEGAPQTEAEGDALLQQLVDLLSTRFVGVTGTKGYTAYTTRNMTLSP
ncbi:hypothetical protein ABZ471_33015 [Streptomyces sp. NPDC005728]|uniref:hypothetical protein n=1 Tax=Streptomyces sp. NPDC005728 TaxID=3157054 RepID=UPI0033DC7389